MALERADSPLRRTGSEWALGLGGLAGVAIIAVAGLAGPAHLAGPRWSRHGAAQSAPAPASGSGASGSSSPSSALSTTHHLPQLGDAWIAAVLLGLAALGALTLCWRLWRARRMRAARELSAAPGRRVATVSAPVPAPETDPDAVADELAEILGAVEAARDSTDVIIRAWLSMEATAERSGIARRPAETPSEFIARVLHRTRATDQAVARLLDGYLRARFSPDPPGPDDVAAVRAALSELLSAWRTEPRRARQARPTQYAR